jgi:CheY-like chemotaxis protein
MSANKASEGPNGDQGGGRGRASVLMVDDRPANLLALEATLESPELDLVRATSGDEALRLALSRAFALILLDVQMPGLGGLETARLLKQRPALRATPIIFLSAEAPTPAELASARQLDAVDYLLKPFDVDALRAKVRAALAPHLALVR